MPAEEKAHPRSSFLVWASDDASATLTLVTLGYGVVPTY